jgi:polar amino acid transport system substrate-binding protein
MPRLLHVVLSVLLLAMLAACGAGSASAPAADASATSPGRFPDLKGRKLVIGTDATYPPFESVDRATDKIVGFDVDLMNEIAMRINVRPEFKNASFDTIFAALEANEFDAVMSAATITEERKKIVDFSEPYLQVGQLIVTNVANDGIKSYMDLATSAAVGVQTGTTGEEAALSTAKVPDATLRRYQAVDLAFADVTNRSIDAVVADGPTVGAYVAQEKYAGKLKIAGEPFTTEDYGIAVRKGDTELLNAINAALKQIPAETIQQLKAKHQIK